MGQVGFGFLRAPLRAALVVTAVVLLVGAYAAGAQGAGGWSIRPSENLSGSNGQLFSESCSARSACTAVGSSVKRSGVGVTLAERWDGKKWSIQSTPSPIGASVSGLFDVACSSSSACMAVGGYATSSGRFVTLAERWNGINWTVVRTPNAARAAGSALFGLACTSPSACIAVGAATARGGFPFRGTLAERWNGKTWSILRTPSAKGGALSDVVCTTALVCIAVGNHTDSSGVRVTLAERWDGNRWRVQATPNPSGAVGGSGLSGVACTSASSCTAVGNYSTSSGGATLAERWNGTKWSIQPTPNPIGVQGSFLNAVACTSASACIAVGSAADSSGHPTALAERWNGTKWSIEPTPPRSGARTSILGDVVCRSRSVCDAVGKADVRTLAERWNGARWRVEPTPNPLGAHPSVLNGVACRPASTCTAVGVKAGPVGNPLGTLAERWNRTRWSIVPTPNPAGTRGSILTAVACQSGSACTAVGFASDRAGNPTATLAERWNGNKWRIQPTPNPAGVPGSLLSAVACTSASACTAVGFTTDSSGNPTKTLAERWNGAHWGIQPTPNPAGAASSLLVGVACTSPSACIAVGGSTDSSGNVTAVAERWNGTEWSIQSTPSPTGGQGSFLNSIACPSASSCTAVGNTADSHGNQTGTLAERWNGTSWSIQPTPNPRGTHGSFLNSVACPSASVCTAVGLAFASGPAILAERWNGTTWTIQPTPSLPGVYDIDPPAVACPSASSCTAVGGYENNGVKVTLAERWSPPHKTPRRPSPTQATRAALEPGVQQLSLTAPSRRAWLGHATTPPAVSATLRWRRPG